MSARVSQVRAFLRLVAWLLVAALGFMILDWLHWDTRMGLNQPPTLVQQVATIGMWLYVPALALTAALVTWRRARRSARH